MAAVIDYIPEQIRGPIVQHLGDFLHEQARVARERPLDAIVNALALTVLGMVAINIVAATIPVPLIMPAIASGLRFGLMAIMGTTIFQAIQNAEVHVVAGPAAERFLAARRHG